MRKMETKMKIKMLCAEEDNFERTLNDSVRKGWNPKFESYNIVQSYSITWHYILLVKE